MRQYEERAEWRTARESPLLIELEDLLLDRRLDDEAMNKRRPRLSDAMDPPDRLRLGRRVNGGLDKENVIGFGQIEAASAALERKKEHFDRRNGAKLLNDACRFLLVAAELEETDRILDEGAGDDHEDVLPLREDQNLMGVRKRAARDGK